jgi:aerobic-type carbon monoxide dehydrogenase small subunit (CoxS/CutS family)
VPPTISFSLNGAPVEVADDGCSLLEALRDRLGDRSAKDGCSPQGQCGCCTVLVDGQPRVACVTPLGRIRGRAVTTVAGLPTAASWAEALCATGGSQCGFCTPGIVVRLAALTAREPDPGPGAVGQALLAHLCRCTGWQTIVEAVGARGSARPARDLDAAARRAAIEGGAPQRVGPAVALGEGGFADDTAPPDALVAVRAADGSWVVGETLTEARRAAGKIQGRRTTAGPVWPIEVPAGDWARTLQTTWVEPAYLEPDASWCRPGGVPVTPLANGGAFGGKSASPVGEIARSLADRHGRPVRVSWSREDVVRLGPKRPPVAAGVRPDGTGVLHVAATPGVAAAITAVVPGFEVVEREIVGPATSVALRGTGWVEACVLATSVTERDVVVTPAGARAEARLDADGTVRVAVRCGSVLDAGVLRSYAIGAAHQALGWVRREHLSVDDLGEVHDLTIRSFGVLRAVDMPRVEVELDDDDGEPVNGSDAVFAAVAAAAWRFAGHAGRWPVER